MSTKSDTYNGWSNWATWNVALWISNDEPTYRHLLLSGVDSEDDAKDQVMALMPNGTPDMSNADEYKSVDWSEILNCIKEF